MPDTFRTHMAAADTVLMDALGETVSVKDASLVDVGTVTGLLERQYVEVGNVQGYAPTFTYQESALTIDAGYEVTYGAQAYNVRIKQSDGTGVALLILGEK